MTRLLYNASIGCGPEPCTIRLGVTLQLISRPTVAPGGDHSLRRVPCSCGKCAAVYCPHPCRQTDGTHSMSCPLTVNCFASSNSGGTNVRVSVAVYKVVLCVVIDSIIQWNLANGTGARLTGVRTDRTMNVGDPVGSFQPTKYCNMSLRRFNSGRDRSCNLLS